MIDSGTHGDEYEVIPIVKTCIEKYLDKLPDLLFVPEVSPSAVAMRRRRNKDGVDLNRSFMDQTPIEEAQNYMDLIGKYKLETLFSFHEDVTNEDFYMYDSFDLRGTEELLKFKKELLGQGIGLYSGLDDPDPALRYQIEEGYCHFKIRDDGTSSYWMAEKGVIQRIMEIEVPGKLSLEKKYFIVDAVFRHFVLPAGKT